MIPAFDPEGNLPPGVHTTTWPLFVKRFGKTDHRRRLISGLKRALDSLKWGGCLRAYIDGSFVTDKERPGDYEWVVAQMPAEYFARYHEMTRWMEQMWYVHGHINFALISGAALSDFYDEVMQPKDPTEAYQILQGYHTRPVDAAHGLWSLSRKVKASPELTRIFDEHPNVHAEVGAVLYDLGRQPRAAREHITGTSAYGGRAAAARR